MEVIWKISSVCGMMCEIMKDEKVTAIITTHRDSLLKICGKVFTLDAGSLAQVESTKRSVTV